MPRVRNKNTFCFSYASIKDREKVIWEISKFLSDNGCFHPGSTYKLEINLVAIVPWEFYRKK